MCKSRKIFPIIFLFLFIFLPLASARENHNQKGKEALDKGDYPKAITQFEIALRQSPQNEVIKKNLSTAYNNYALKLAEENKTEEAIEILKKALRLQKGPVLLKNITALCVNQGYTCLENREYKKAEKFLQEALSYDKNNTTALSLLGNVYYDTQKIKKAKEFWGKSLAINPQQEGIKKRLDKISGEIEIETKLDKVSNYHFDLRYQENAVRNQEYKIRDYLEQAYREVGQDFNYFPKYKIVVLIYSTEDYQKLINIRSLGFYDGKIRVSADQVLDAGKLKEIIYHEYTHVLVRDLSGGNCPTWLNEGLAQYEQYKNSASELEHFYKILSQRGLIPFENLDATFVSPSMLNLAYQQSYCFVSYIIKKYRMWRIKNILSELKQGKNIKEAFRHKCYLDLEKFEKSWQRDRF